MLENKIKEAEELHRQGFNCAQSVALPFCEELGLDRVTAMRAMEGFGAGMGGMRQTCGALSGAIFIAGLQHSDGNVNAPASKKGTYAVCRQLGECFVRECGSGVCAEIKGVDTGKMLTSCDECIRVGVRLAMEAMGK